MNHGLTVDALELWRGDNRLVNNLSFGAAAGTLVRIAGKNGCGKTTLLRAVCGLTHPESGKITWDGTDIEKELGTYHANLAWLGHRNGLKPELSVTENLALHHRVQGRRPDTVTQDMERAEVSHLADLPVRSLSAGQKRRVAFAKVICSGARLWLLDEPFANLDTAAQQWGLEQIRQHVADGGISILSTHLTFDDADVVTVDLSA